MKSMNKIVKKSFAILTVLLYCLSSEAYDFSSNYNGVTIYYTANSTAKTASVTYKDENYNSYTASNITIPKTVSNGGTTYTVTSIDRAAFYKCSNVASVTLPTASPQ